MKQAGSQTYRILVVDDDQPMREFSRRMLQQTGFACDAVRDGIDAEKALLLHRYDAVLTDLRMPRKHGHQLILDLLSKQSCPLIVVLTGICEPKIAFDLISRGVSDFLLKPCNYDLLAAKLRALLQHPNGKAPTHIEDRATPIEIQIDKAAQTLNAQLAGVTESFQTTIQNLTKQKERLEDDLLRSVRVLENLMSLGPSGVESHASRTERMAHALGTALGLQRVELQRLRVAALLHDIGQFGMPDSIRNAPPWTLPSEQLAVYQRYPIIGAAVVAEIPGLEDVVTLIESHAENYDGSGFPAQRRGEAIPLGARILRIADGLDTHLSHHTDGDSFEIARVHLVSQRDRAYDPGLTPLVLQFLTEINRKEDQNNATIVRVEDLKPGMILAEGLYDPHGHFLVRAGAPLTPSMLTLLRRLIPCQSIGVHPTRHDSGID